MENEQRLEKVNNLIEQFESTLKDPQTTFNGVVYKLDDFADWDEFATMFDDTVKVSICALINLGVAGYKNRNDWSEGYSYVEDTFDKYADVLARDYPEVYDEYSNILNSDTMTFDGRIFRDTDHSYRVLWNTANTLIEFDKDLTTEQRKILSKLIKPTNLEFIVNKMQFDNDF